MSGVPSENKRTLKSQRKEIRQSRNLRSIDEPSPKIEESEVVNEESGKLKS